ncbi:MAG: hypothetical protein L6R39_007602 [Caloplaca ligustica]|nr:MAG: hypothetical protein L6R39_007602 [Caloplaca ligustica]
MPVLTRRQHMMTETPRSSTDSSSQGHVWVVRDDYEKPQKEMDFPSANLSNKMPRHDLRLTTYPKGDLHDRYMSSEEEPSPSPDSSDAESTHSEELKHKSSARLLAEEAPIDYSALDSDAEPAVAVAMPILAYGRPKLIDITNLAPMHRRKRAIKQPVAPSSKQQANVRAAATKTDTEKPFIANEAAEMVVPLEKAADIARKQAAMTASRRLKQQQSRQTLRTPVSSAPESWLPEEEEEQHDNTTTADDEEREYHFPGEYEPFSLQPIQPRPPQHSPLFGRKRNTFTPAIAGVGKGLTRTWSIAKKGVASHTSSSSTTTTSSSSGGATYAASSPQPQEREQKPYQPERQVTKKPKMIARGANERAESFVLPPCPFDVAA